MDVEKLKAILAVLRDTDVTRIEWSDGAERIELRFGHPPAATSAPLAAPAHHAPLPSLGSPSSSPATGHSGPHAAPSPAAQRPDSKSFTVASPFVGTFYRTASPDSPPFVDVGTVVKKGQVLCIVEAMKLMNEIEAEQAGRVVEVLAQSGSPVEYGEPLFRLEPA